MEKISIEENFKLEDMKNVEKLGKLSLTYRRIKRFNRYG